MYCTFPVGSVQSQSVSMAAAAELIYIVLLFSLSFHQSAKTSCVNPPPPSSPPPGALALRPGQRSSPSMLPTCRLPCLLVLLPLAGLLLSQLLIGCNALSKSLSYWLVFLMAMWCSEHQWDGWDALVLVCLFVCLSVGQRISLQACESVFVSTEGSVDYFLFQSVGDDTLKTKQRLWLKWARNCTISQPERLPSLQSSD